MYLKKLIIAEEINEKKIIRDITFKKGLNFIVDSSKNYTEKGNNVGKTTVLKIIDLCLASKARASIWSDDDTGSINTTLKEYLEVHKVYAQLQIQAEDKIYNLKVQLFNRGHRYINNENLSYDAYKEALNKIVFKNSLPKPTIRELIGKFVRIGQNAEKGNILKYSHQNVSNAEYRNIYNYLFNLTSSENSSRILEKTQQINKENNDLKHLIRINNFSNIEDLNERINIVSKDVQTLQIELDYLLENKFTEESFKKRDTIEKELQNLDLILDRLTFEITKTKQIINNMDSPSINIEINNNLLKELFEETQNEFGKLNKKFSDLVEFNKKITNNKIDYYSKKLKVLNSKYNNLINIRKQILTDNKELFEIIGNGKFNSFEEVHANLLYQNQLLGELQRVKEIYNNFKQSISSKEKEKEQLMNVEDKKDNLSIFNEYFTPLSQKALHQRLYLTRDNKFPLKLSNVEEGLGTGNKKTIALLLDIAYVSFIKEVNLKFPYFFIHDILETIDQASFKVIVDTINNNGSQFITAVLREKIDSYNFIKEDDIRLELSVDNRLFKV